MGVLIPNHPVRVQHTGLDGRKVSTIETQAQIVDGTILSVKQGREEGSASDGSLYATAEVRIKPGVRTFVTAYEGGNKELLETLKPGDSISAFLEPMVRKGTTFGYRVKEFASTMQFPTETATTAPAPASEVA